MSLSVKTQGGTGGMTASIFVTGLSESDTVTASYGDKTKVAIWNSTESRHEITGIGDKGMWTVTATNGKKTRTQEVLVDGAFDYEIEMDYKLWLYRDGDECEDVTGGWKSVGCKITTVYSPQTPTLIKNDTNMYVEQYGAMKSGYIAPQNMVDMSECSKIFIEFENLFNGYYIGCRLYTSATITDMNDLVSESVFNEFENGTGGVKVVNIAEEHRKNMYLTLAVYCGSTEKAPKCTIKNVWLE